MSIYDSPMNQYRKKQAFRKDDFYNTNKKKDSVYDYENNCNKKRRLPPAHTLEPAPEITNPQINRARDLLIKELIKKIGLYEKLIEDFRDNNYVSNDLETLEELIIGADIDNQLLDFIINKKSSADFQQSMRIILSRFGIDMENIYLNKLRKKAIPEMMNPKHKFRVNYETGNVDRGGGPNVIEDYQLVPPPINPLNLDDVEYTTNDLTKIWKDNKMVDRFALADLMIRHDPFLSALYKNFRNSKQKYVQDRKKKVSNTDYINNKT